MVHFINDSQLYLDLEFRNSFDRISNNECEKKRFFVAPIKEAANSAGTGCGSQASFITLAPSPKLSAPSNGANLTSTYLFYSWMSVAGASQYRFELSKDPNFSTAQNTVSTCPSGFPGTSIVNYTTTSSTQLCINHGTSTQNGVWYWRVCANISGSWGPWSAESSYTWTW